MQRMLQRQLSAAFETWHGNGQRAFPEHNAHQDGHHGTVYQNEYESNRWDRNQPPELQKSPKESTRQHQLKMKKALEIRDEAWCVYIVCVFRVLCTS